MNIAPPPYTICDMALSHLNDVLAINRLSFPTMTKRALFEYELSENKLASYRSLFEYNCLIGYDGFWVIGDEIHISTIAIHPKWRRRGLGELLLLNLLYIAQSAPVTLVTLEVRASNSNAQELYKKYKFEGVGRRKNYYRDTGEDAILMTLSPLNAPYQNFLDQMKAPLFAKLKK